MGMNCRINQPGLEESTEMHPVCGRLTAASYVEVREERTQESKDSEVVNNHQTPT